MTHIHCECNCTLAKGVLFPEILLSNANRFVCLFPLRHVHFHMLFCNLHLFVGFIDDLLKHCGQSPCRSPCREFRSLSQDILGQRILVNSETCSPLFLVVSRGSTVGNFIGVLFCSFLLVEQETHLALNLKAVGACLLFCSPTRRCG